MFSFQVEKTQMFMTDKEPMTSGSVAVYMVHFDFSSDWDGFYKTAVFKSGSLIKNIWLGVDSDCLVPWEVLVLPNQKIQVGVYGEDTNGAVLPTVWADLGPVLVGVVADGSEPSPTPESWEQALTTKQDKLTGTPGQVVGFNTDGDAVPQEAPAFEDAVTVPGGATTEMAQGFGEGPYTFEYVDDEEEGGAVSASQVSYDNAASGIQATTVQSAVDWVTSVILTGGVPYGKELTESWASLQARIKAGNFAGIRIGDFKTITLTTGETVIMEVAGIDQYYRCGDQEIGHHIDFISRDCLSGAKVFNDTDTNQGTAAEPNPWRASKLFQTLNDEASGVYATLPTDLKPCIIEKRALLETRFSEAGALNDSTGVAWNNMGKLWLPTEVEVFANSVWSDETFGADGSKQYPIFIGGSLHLIKGDGNGGTRVSWREASTQRASATNACSVSYDGGAYYYGTANEWICAPLCFRIG